MQVFIALWKPFPDKKKSLFAKCFRWVENNATEGNTDAFFEVFELLDFDKSFRVFFVFFVFSLAIFPFGFRKNYTLYTSFPPEIRFLFDFYDFFLIFFLKKIPYFESKCSPI